MDTNKMREQASNEFDAWLDGYEKDREANGWMPLEPYVRKHMRNAFVASREALVIELPEPQQKPEIGASQYREGKSDGIESGIIQCIKAIERQGFKVEA